MKSTKLIALLGGLLVSGMALAATPDLTVDTSANLVGNYSVYDSGLYTNNWTYWGAQSNYLTSTTASILGTHQDATTGQWFQTTQFTQTTSYDYLAYDYTSTTRNVSLTASGGVTGDQWIDLSLSTSTPMSFTAYAYGSNGSKTSPRGLTQTITPGLGVFADGTASAVTAYSYPWNDYSWQASSNGTVSSSFLMSAEATDGGTINSLSVSLATDAVLTRAYTEHNSYVSSSWTTDALIAAPVPEPESYAMLLAGLGMMGAIARRRKAKQAS